MRSKQIEHIAIWSDNHVKAFMVIESTWEFQEKKHSPPIKRTKLVVFWFVVNIERFYFDRSNAYMIMVKLIEIHSKSHFEYDFGVDQTPKKNRQNKQIYPKM